MTWVWTISCDQWLFFKTKLMYNNQTLTPQTQILVKNTAKALLAAGQTVKPSDVARYAKVQHSRAIQDLIDEIYENDLQIRRQITTEGFHITFAYTRVVPKVVEPEKEIVSLNPKVHHVHVGFTAELDLSECNPNFYVAYAHNLPPALFDTTDKYVARTKYKELLASVELNVRHNDVRMTRLETFLKK
jgi:hypothetical protein